MRDRSPCAGWPPIRSTTPPCSRCSTSRAGPTPATAGAASSSWSATPTSATSSPGSTARAGRSTGASSAPAAGDDAELEARQWEADHFEDVPVIIVPCVRGRRPCFPAIGRGRVLRRGVSRGAEPAARGDRARPRRRRQQPRAVVPLAGPPHARAPPQRHARRGRARSGGRGAVCRRRSRRSRPGHRNHSCTSIRYGHQPFRVAHERTQRARPGRPGDRRSKEAG